MSLPENEGDAMPYDFGLIRVRLQDRVLFARIDAPPLNVMTMQLFSELDALSRAVQDDDVVGVLVLESADPDFFIAHFDVEALLAIRDRPEAELATASSGFHAMCERYRTMPKVTIAKIAGRVGGGGSELAASCDMRFGVLGKTTINQMEVGVGILPGGTGTQRLPRLVGRGRALEVILGSADLDAETAERWGYLNRAVSADALDAVVDDLARRIASFPPEAVALAKQAVDAAELPLADGLAREAALFRRAMQSESAGRRMRAFLDLGGQTRAGEMRVAELVAGVAAAVAPKPRA